MTALHDGALGELMHSEWIKVKPRPHVIVVGNEKGGSGKTTTAIHLIVGLMKRGYRVGSLDVDGRQATLTRYLENRFNQNRKSGEQQEISEHYCVAPSPAYERAEADRQEAEGMWSSLMELRACDAIVIDTPGTDSTLSRLAHGVADTLLTPLNDSFLDLDLIARIDSDHRTILNPSLYAEQIWDLRERRKQTMGAPLTWYIMRNRISQTDTKGRKEMEQLLRQLARQFQFRVIGGFSERAIFRELFLEGLTLWDMEKPGIMKTPTIMSLGAARAEVVSIVDAMEAEIR